MVAPVLFINYLLSPSSVFFLGTLASRRNTVVIASWVQISHTSRNKHLNKYREFVESLGYFIHLVFCSLLLHRYRVGYLLVSENYTLGVQQLVPLLVGKSTKGVDGSSQSSVNHLKVCLVAKGYTKVYGIDYLDTFSRQACSLFMFLSLATYWSLH